MGDLPNNLWMDIQWMDDKRTEAGWTDIRQNRKVHSFYWIRAGKGTFVTDSDKVIAVRPGMLFYLKPGLEMSMASEAVEPLRITMVLLKLLSIHANEDQHAAPASAPAATTASAPAATTASAPAATTASAPASVHASTPAAAPAVAASAVGSAMPVPALDLPFLTIVEGEQQHHIDKLFSSLTSGWVPGQPAGELKTKAILYQLLFDIVQLQYVSPSADEGSVIFKKIKEELETGFPQEIRLKTVAATHGISVSYLREMFHRYLGTSPKSYLDQVRNEHAKKRLIYTDLPVREIGESCGYTDEYHFSKRFKQANGVPPLVFRKMNRQ